MPFVQLVPSAHFGQPGPPQVTSVQELPPVPLELLALALLVAFCELLVAVWDVLLVAPCDALLGAPPDAPAPPSVSTSRGSPRPATSWHPTAAATTGTAAIHAIDRRIVHQPPCSVIPVVWAPIIGLTLIRALLCVALGAMTNVTTPATSAAPPTASAASETFAVL